jgi:CHAD domain-containing protein
MTGGKHGPVVCGVMKHTAIQHLVEKRMRSIGNYYTMIMEDCTMENIHDLRVQIKKLRAFVALVNMAQPGKMPLSIHPQLKQFYDIAGELRSLQLQQQRIVLLCSDRLLQPPVYYLQYLYDKQEVLQQTLHDQLLHAGHVGRLLLHELPATIPNKAIDKFAEEKAATIHHLMHMPVDDNVLHEIRKQYKQVLYNLKHMAKRHTPACEFFSNNREAITAITTTLGNYHDLHTALFMVWYYTVNQYNPHDGAVLQTVEDSFLHAKLLLKPQAIRQLQAIAGINVSAAMEV